ncbi:MAG: M56 family metallopeptidase, partial [Candidatus Latescibacterota bacterium]
MTPVSYWLQAPLLSWLGQAMLKTSLVLLAVLAADLLLHRRLSAWKNLMWKAGLAAALAVPFLSLVLPALPLLPPARTGVSPVALREAGVSGPGRAPEPTPALAGSVPALAAPAPASEVGPSRPPTARWPAVLLTVYATGAAAVLAVVLVGLGCTARAARTAAPVTDERWGRELIACRRRLGIRRPVRLACSTRVPVPAQAGLFRPTVLLPTSMLDQGEPSLVRTAIVHELAHVRRWDFAFHVVAGLALAVHWCNPLLWLAVRRLRDTGEQACDDWSVAVLGDWDPYAHDLLWVAARLRRGTRLAFEPRMARRPRIAGRIDRIVSLAGEVSPRIGRISGTAFAAGVATCVALVSACALHGRPAEEPAAALRVALGPAVRAQMDTLVAGMRLRQAQNRQELAVRRAALWQAETPTEEFLRAEKLLLLHEQADSLWTQRMAAWDQDRDWRPVAWGERCEVSNDLTMMAVEAFNQRLPEIGLFLCQRAVEAHPFNLDTYNIKWRMLLPVLAVRDSIPARRAVGWIRADLAAIDDLVYEPGAQVPRHGPRLYDGSLSPGLEVGEEGFEKLRQEARVTAYWIIYQWTRSEEDRQRLVAALETRIAQDADAAGTPSTGTAGGWLGMLAGLTPDPARRLALLERMLRTYLGPPDIADHLRPMMTPYLRASAYE